MGRVGQLDCLHYSFTLPLSFAVVKILCDQVFVGIQGVVGLCFGLEVFSFVIACLRCFAGFSCFKERHRPMGLFSFGKRFQQLDLKMIFFGLCLLVNWSKEKEL